MEIGWCRMDKNMKFFETLAKWVCRPCVLWGVADAVRNKNNSRRELKLLNNHPKASIRGCSLKTK